MPGSGRRHRPPTRRRARPALAGALAAALALAPGALACSGDDAPAAEPGTPAARGGWEELPQAPLTARNEAVAVWTGEEVLVVGGHSDEGCSRRGDCADPNPADLTDGAAYDPEAREWRPIADAPRPLAWASTAVVDGVAYLFDGSDGAGLLRYDPGADRWDEVPTPFRDPDWWNIAGVPGGLVAYVVSEEEIERPMFAYDPARQEWSEVPADPLSPGFNRSVTAIDGGWALSDIAMLRTSDAEPGPVRVAVFDQAAGTWERLPDGNIQDASPFHDAGGQLVNALTPTPDVEGTMHARGGILDLEARTWSDLPDTPDAAFDGGGNVVTGDDAFYTQPRGLVLDVESRAWVEMPPLEGEPRRDEMWATDRHTFTAAGRDLFVFGGTRWAGNEVDYDMLDDAWMWSPP